MGNAHLPHYNQQVFRAITQFSCCCMPYTTFHKLYSSGLDTPLMVVLYAWSFLSLSLYISFEFSLSFCTDFLPFSTQFTFWSLFPGFLLLCQFLPCFASQPKVIQKHTDTLRSSSALLPPLKGHSTPTLMSFWH